MHFKNDLYIKSSWENFHTNLSFTESAKYVYEILLRYIFSVLLKKEL